MERKLINYEYVSFIVDLLEQRVDKDYDFIIGVGRGGLIPATMLAYKLNKKVMSIGIKTYDDMTQSDSYSLYQPLNVPDNKTKALVVDDICDSGNTFNIINQLYGDNKNIDLHFAALFTKDKSSHYVDHYGLSIAEGIWLDFPWE
jgi:hypoxanthine phosphoribosyltransferase